VNRRAVIIAFAPLACALGLGAWGCNTAGLMTPDPPLRAASASLYAVDLEFDLPVERATAEDVSRYAVHPLSSPGTSYTIASATLIDTLDARVVQLILPDWFGDSTFDHQDFTVTSDGVRNYLGSSTGQRSTTFRSGLEYATSPADPYADGMKGFFDSHCVSCHGAVADSGNYRCDSYAALFGAGTDPTPNLIAGDPTCLLVRKCKPHNSMFNRGAMTYFDFERLRNWVEIYGARP